MIDQDTLYKRHPDSRAANIVAACDAVEFALQQNNCWQGEPLPAAVYTSSAPFSIDTMTLVQWLQFVCLPQLRRCLQQHQALPTASAIKPVLEEWLQSQRLHKPMTLLKAVGNLDDCFNASD